MKELGLSSIRAVEDLLILGLYNSVFTGRLDHDQSRIDLSATIGRDIQHSQNMADELDFLTKWATQTEGVLSWLENRIYSLDKLQEDREKKDGKDKDI